MNPAATSSAPQWVQVLLSILGVLGGLGGLGAIVTVVVQRGKFKADAADTLTDAALTLVQPLRARLVELEREMAEVRTELASARDSMHDMGVQIRTLTSILERWREAIDDPQATLRKVRALVARTYRQPPPR